jgi:hypothetical protein
MWKKYIEKYFELMKKNFFVNMSDLGVTEEEIKILEGQVKARTDAYIDQYPGHCLELTIGIQLAENIMDEVLTEIREKERVICEYAYDKRDLFLSKEFEKLSFAERHFWILWAYHGFASGNPGRLGNIPTIALQAYSLSPIKDS